ncbi:MAG: trans-aconitate 2-methyltransferase [Acidimicrobiales bacterium]
MTAREWDAASYDRVAIPQARWAAPLLDHLRPQGVHRLLDAGCGSGRVTQAVLERLPDAHVVALDGSRHMLDEAARRLAPEVAAGRVSFVHADLNRPIPLDEPVDAIVSTATFHWVPDHDDLFANLASVLRPGGQLVAQCGGAGNVGRVVVALADIGESWHPWVFPSAEEAAARLESNGFASVRTWLHDESATFETRAALEEFLATVVLGAHLHRLAAEERQPFVGRVAGALPGPTIDYVRLNMLAVRAGG